MIITIKISSYPDSPRESDEEAHREYLINFLEDQIDNFELGRRSVSYTLPIVGIILFICSLLISHSLTGPSWNDDNKTGLLAISSLFFVISSASNIWWYSETKTTSKVYLSLSRIITRCMGFYTDNEEWISQLKQIVRELSNWPNVMDFLFIIPNIFAWIGLLIGHCHLMYLRYHRDEVPLDSFANIIFILTTMSIMVGSLKFPVTSWIRLYRLKKTVESSPRK